MPATLTSETRRGDPAARRRALRKLRGERSSDPQLVALRARIVAGAARVAEESFGILHACDALRVCKPPREHRGGEWDWLERLDPRERARLAAWWSDSPADIPDAVAERIRASMPTLENVSDDEVLRTVWLRHTRLVDAGGAIARGRFPSGRRYSSALDVSAFAPDVESDGYDVATIMGDDAEALEHVRMVDATRETDGAYRALGAATRCAYGPAPWTMTADALEHEHRTLCAMLAGREALTMSKRDATSRLAELAPAGIDRGQDYAQLHADIIEAANIAGLLQVPTIVRLPRVAGKGKRGPKRSVACGTPNAWRAHQRNHEHVDAACAAAWARYQREAYAARKARKQVAA